MSSYVYIQTYNSICCPCSQIYCSFSKLTLFVRLMEYIYIKRTCEATVEVSGDISSHNRIIFVAPHWICLIDVVSVTALHRNCALITNTEEKFNRHRYSYNLSIFQHRRCELEESHQPQYTYSMYINCIYQAGRDALHVLFLKPKLILW